MLCDHSRKCSVWCHTQITFVLKVLRGCDISVSRKGIQMVKLGFEALLIGVSIGGGAGVAITSHLEPSVGQHGNVKPAKYVGGNNGATYVKEDRFIDGELRRTVLIDSPNSLRNRLEDAINDVIQAGNSIYSRIPSMQVKYRVGNEERILRDTELPHKAYDAHFRSGTIEGRPATENEVYREIRNSTPANARPLLEYSPMTLIGGGWDSTRKTNQARFPATVVGEIIGIIEGEGGREARDTLRSGARIDPLGAKIELSKEVAKELAEAQKGDLSQKTYDSVTKAKGVVSGSSLGLGAIPPGVKALDGIATVDIIKSYSVSFATLRRLRFGDGVESDVAIRALLAALTFAAIARYDADGYLRAGTHLVEKTPSVVRLDKGAGKFEELEPLTIAEADALFAEALEYATKVAGVDWHGQVLEIEGHADVAKSAQSDIKESNEE